MKKHNPTHRAPRSGFTLIELLAVITIIAILLALILPAISNAFGGAKETDVSVEMTQFDQALSTFNAKFNRYPPSSITLYGTSAGWNGDPAAKSIIRSLWRDFDFSTGGRGPGHAWGTGDKVLTGDECLVFFLAGVPVDNGATIPPTMTGFSANGRFPFSTVGQNRVGPFFDGWKEAGVRLVDNIAPFESAADQIYSYTDGLSTSKNPMVYSASENGRYAPNWAAYYQGDGVTPWNKNTYQLIAPGEDGEYGTIDETSAGGKVVWTEETELSAGRKPEADNITSFSGGRLGR